MKKTNSSLLLLLTLQLAIPILSTDIYLPSLSAIAKYFNASTAQIQFTLTGYFFIFGISQLIYGPLSDYFGRKPILILSLAIYNLATDLAPIL